MLMSPDHTLYEVGNGRQRQTSREVAVKQGFVKNRLQWQCSWGKGGWP